MGEHMKVLFITNYPSPYRVEFFNLLGQNVDLTVAFTERIENQKHRSSAWFNSDYSGFHEVFLNRLVRIGKKAFYKDVISLVKQPFDFIILGGYSSLTLMVAIEYMRLHRIPFAIEADGGMVKEESFFYRRIKKHFIGSASWWISSGKITTEYFLHYGAKKEKIYVYPFTSLRERDVLETRAEVISNGIVTRKKQVRDTLRISENKMILFVGQMIQRKGIDILLHAAKEFPDEVGVYILGGDPPDDYLSLRTELRLKHVYFVGFKGKTELADYFRAADVFVLPTREDIWGLVINEAMSFGLPIVSTDRCVAALELVENNINGIIVPVNDPEALANGIKQVLESDLDLWGRHSLDKISDYTIEKMVAAHMDIFAELC